MRGLVAVLSVLGVVSCKTSDPSKLDSVHWRHRDKIILIHYEKPKDTFIVHSCPESKQLEVAFKVDKTLESALKACNGTSTVVAPVKLTDAISAEISAPAQNKIVDVKRSYMLAIKENLDNLKIGLLSLEEDTEDTRPEHIANIQKLRSTITELTNEYNQLDVVVESKKDDTLKTLKTMDMDKTASLQTKVASATKNYAEIFTSMLKDKETIYSLSPDRDMTLIDAIKDFSPTCFEGMRNRGIKEVFDGDMKRTIQCRPDGIAEVLKVECTTADYVLLQKEGSNMYCSKKSN